MARRPVKSAYDDDLGVGDSGSRRTSERNAYTGKHERDAGSEYRRDRGASGRRSSYDEDDLEIEDDLPVRKSGRDTRLTRPADKITTADDDTYIIRAINETDVSGYSAFRKLAEGIPLFCNWRYTLTLVSTQGAGHGKKGQNINATIWGKIEDANLSVQDTVRVSGRRIRGRYTIKKLYDQDAGEYVRINRNWKSPDSKGNASGSGVIIALMVLAAVLVLGAVLGFLGYVQQLPQDFWNRVKIGIIVILFIAFLFITRFRILQYKSVQMIVGFLVLAFIALYVPGGESLFACAVIIWILYRLLIKIF